MEHTKVTVIANGPLMVEGTIKITKADGTTEVKEQKSFFVPLRTFFQQALL